MPRSPGRPSTTLTATMARPSLTRSPVLPVFLTTEPVADYLALVVDHLKPTVNHVVDNSTLVVDQLTLLLSRVADHIILVVDHLTMPLTT